MLISLHNHTTLCNHATGSIQAYIEKAIEHQINYFGFSEHAPMNFDPKYRMKLDECDEYEASILELKKKYQDKIDILLAYEVDYIDKYLEERILKANVDYLIGSVHFLQGWGFDNYEFIKGYENKDIDQIWQDYFDTIENMAKSGHFDIVGHMDLIKVFKFLPKKDIRLIAKNAIKSIKDSQMVVEINSAGFRKPINEQYPSRLLLEMCFEMDIPITCSADAHSIDDVGYKLQEIHHIAQEIGYTELVIFKQRDKVFLPF